MWLAGSEGEHPGIDNIVKKGGREGGRGEGGRGGGGEEGRGGEGEGRRNGGREFLATGFLRALVFPTQHLQYSCLHTTRAYEKV